MELFIFVRFDAKQGKELAVAEALQEVVTASRQEEGCLGIHAFHSIRDDQVFYIQSRWRDEAAFDLHAGLPHTLRFIERVEPLLVEDIRAQRCAMLA